MAVSFSCKCPEQNKVVQKRAWIVVHRRYIRNEHCRTPSDCSLVFCRKCHALGRTKAAYVDILPDASANFSEQYARATYSAVGERLAHGGRMVSHE